MIRKIKYSGIIEIEIPDEKIQEVLDDFKEIIDSTATKEDMFFHIAHNIVYCGCNDFVEGIGNDFNIESYDKPDMEIEREPE